MELSKRLQAVANLVTAGYITADIGTDHAYIPIYLVGDKIVPSALAMDIGEGPLERAREHVARNGLSDKISLRLSDGLKALEPGEAGAAVLAGMGGPLVMKILKDRKDVALSLKECILQPQSEIANVRAFLLEEGFLFIQEDMVFENGKFYPMMKVKPPSGGPHEVQVWTKTQIRYGKRLLDGRHPVLKQFLEKEISLKTQIIAELEKLDSGRAKQRLQELRQDLAQAQEGMKYYAL